MLTLLHIFVGPPTSLPAVPMIVFGCCLLAVAGVGLVVRARRS